MASEASEAGWSKKKGGHVHSKALWLTSCLAPDGKIAFHGPLPSTIKILLPAPPLSRLVAFLLCSSHITCTVQCPASAQPVQLPSTFQVQFLALPERKANLSFASSFLDHARLISCPRPYLRRLLLLLVSHLVLRRYFISRIGSTCGSSKHNPITLVLCLF